MKPLAVDLFCGLGGWSDGFLTAGYDVVGFDIEARPYPAQLVLQDVLTIHGAQFRNAAAIVASPPCQEYSYMAQPWSRGKQIAAALRGKGEFPSGYEGSRGINELNALFETCFRIQREASESAGRYIPMVVENVKGAQPWVGRSRAAFGSFHLWGDVDSIGGRIVRRGDVRWGAPSVKAATRGQKFNPDGTEYGQGSWFAIADSRNRGSRKSTVGSWDLTRENYTPDHAWDDGRKVSPNCHAEGLEDSGVKQTGSGPSWFDNGIAKLPSSSPRRAQASAKIAMIPPDLARHIARIFKPHCTGMGMKSCSDAM